MKNSVVVGRVVKVAAVVVITATITWQARTQHEARGNQSEGFTTQQAGFMPEPWVKHRKAQVKELTRSMPNRFALSKAYYGTENALLEAAALDRLKANGATTLATPKS